MAHILRRIARRLLAANEGESVEPRPSRFQEFSIGIYSGTSPFHFAPAGDAPNPALTARDVSDVRATIVADPFMIEREGRWYMFFEVMNAENGRGEIGLAESADAVRWSYRRIVLAEKFHLSYPYVFEWEGGFWMVPESHQAGEIRLYRADPFPGGWSFVKTLVAGPRFSDSSLVRHGGRWWLFTETDRTMRFATAGLYWADDLMGPWREHPKSPIVEGDPHAARSGGRILQTEGRIIRYIQDCHPDYGLQVTATEVTELTPDVYRDRTLGPDPVLTGSGTGWNRDGMHHIDAHRLGDGRWIACVDGWSWATA